MAVRAAGAFDRDGGFGEPELPGVGIGVDGVEDAVAEVVVDEAEPDWRQGGGGAATTDEDQRPTALPTEEAIGR